MTVSNPVILFRRDLSLDNELEICTKHVRTVEMRSQIQKDDLVIGRFSVLPYYSELEREKLNTWAQKC